MTPGDPHRELELLHEAAERVSANLVELEIDSSRQLLEASRLEGVSAERWSAANAALTELWRRQALLEKLLEQADKLRGGRKSADLAALLEGPSIELSSAAVPLAQRDLLGSSEAANRCSPRALLGSMSTAFDQVKTVVSQIGGAWETLVPEVDAARRLLQECRRLTEELGDSTRRDLESADQTLDRLASAVTTDPLSVELGDIRGAQETLRGIRDELRDSLALKRGFESRTLAARGLLEQLRAVVGQAQAAHEELLLKVSIPSPPAAPTPHPELDLELTRISELAGQGAWAEAGRSLRDWTDRTEGLLDEARRALHANQAPIEARNQLRGLLDAYQVKAKRLGVLEHPELQEIFARAQDELYTAPSDLSVAAQLVRGYQTALTASQSVPEATQ